MNNRVLVRCLDGTVGSFILNQPFSLGDEQIEVTSEADGTRQRFLMYDLCQIRFQELPPSLAVLKCSAGPAVIETALNEAFQVMFGRIPDGGGFVAHLMEEGEYRFFFFPRSGVRNITLGQRLGEMLAADGLIAPGELDDALAEQQRLRTRRIGEIIAEQNSIPQQQVEETVAAAAGRGETPARVRIGDILVSSGLVTRQQVEEALASQKEGKKKKIGELLIERGLITEDQLLKALADRFNLRFADIDEITPTPEALELVPYEMAVRLNVLPVECGLRHLLVATSNPTDPAIADTLRFATRRSISQVVGRSQQIRAAIARCYARTLDPVRELLDELKGKVVAVEEEVRESAFTESDSQIINLVNKVLIEAFQRGVSDIHFEPGTGKQSLCIRYRIDGICRVAHYIAAPYKGPVIARLKIMSHLDIAEHRRPQSGKILIRFEQNKLEFRVEITPTVNGQEDAVLRLLASARSKPLTELNFSPGNLLALQDLLTKPHGMILCVGPTGSGKTTSLHSALGHINTPERKIWTAEDPVEITQPGLRQVQVNAKIGFTFQEALRSFLRADPDVIMVGEMRDLETAKIAIQASLTGHLVFSTLHTNSAVETVGRLVEMGIEPLNFAEALLGILAQRLTRRLCVECRRPYHPTLDEYHKLLELYDARRYREHGLPEYRPEMVLMQKTGCDVCGHEGYRGRIAVHELLCCTPAMRNLLKSRVSSAELTELALIEGMRTLRMDGIYKVLQGETDLIQILNVTG